MGLTFQMAADPTTYTVAAVASPTQLTLDRGYQGSSQSGQAYQILATLSWQQSSPATDAPLRLVQQHVLDLIILSTPAAGSSTDERSLLGRQPGTARYSL